MLFPVMAQPDSNASPKKTAAPPWQSRRDALSLAKDKYLNAPPKFHPRARAQAEL
jgi:hypothetical protein